MKKTMNYRKFLLPALLGVLIIGLVGIVSAEETTIGDTYIQYDQTTDGSVSGTGMMTDAASANNMNPDVYVKYIDDQIIDPGVLDAATHAQYARGPTMVYENSYRPMSINERYGLIAPEAAISDADDNGNAEPVETA